MRKEPIIAIILGSLIGVLVAFGVWQSTKRVSTNNIKQDNIVENNNIQKNSDSKNNNINNKFSLLKPLNNSVYSTSDITVSGLTSSNSIIVIENNSKTIYSLSNSKGEFEVETEAVGGLNNLIVYSLNNNDNFSEQVTFMYSNQIDNSENNIFSLLMGTVTDISENTIQIKTLDDIIEQVSTNDNTSYASTNGKTEDLEFSEIALGDLIAVIGQKADETNGVFKSTRILVVTEQIKSDIKVIYGNIKTLSSSDFLVEDFGGEEFSIEAKGKLSITKLNNENEFVRAKLGEASDGEKIIIIGKLDEDSKEIIASKIHIFPVEVTEEE